MRYAELSGSSYLVWLQRACQSKYQALPAEIQAMYLGGLPISVLVLKRFYDGCHSVVHIIRQFGRRSRDTWRTDSLTAQLIDNARHGACLETSGRLNYFH